MFQAMATKMESLYGDLAEYFVFDVQKYTLEEFMSDIKTFKNQFKVKFNTIGQIFYKNVCQGKEGTAGSKAVKYLPHVDANPTVNQLRPNFCSLSMFFYNFPYHALISAFAHRRRG